LLLQTAGDAICFGDLFCGIVADMKKPLKGLLIGAGFFSRNHLHSWAEVEGAEITAICDRDVGRAQAAANAFNIAHVHEDAAILKSGAFDFVDICTTMETHEALVGLAVDAKVPVIVQKPFAPDFATCLRIEAKARAAARFWSPVKSATSPLAA
jgi:D-apiose dehydrogenase